MGQRKILAGAAAAVLATTMAFSACSPGDKTADNQASNAGINTDTSLSVMWNQPFYSYNSSTNTGNATANANVIYLSNDQVIYYDKDLKLQPNASYGKYEKVPDDPPTMKITIADTAQWSDGVPVTAADYLLQWGATSTQFNTITDEKASETLYDEDGNLKKTSGNDVYFESASPAAALITEFPQGEAAGKEFTYTYSKAYADWEPNQQAVGMPAHIVAKRALGIADPTEAKQAIIDAFKNKDSAALAKIANVWNLDWNFTKMPTDKELVVGTGAYTISDFKEGQYLTLTANPNYKGDHKAAINKITIRYNEDPMAAVQALENGEVQLISPQSTADVLAAVNKLQGVKVQTGEEGTYEHVDLTFNNKGPFDPKSYGGDEEKALKVRQAFLKTIPREKIISDIIKPLNPEAAVRNSFTTVPGSAAYDSIAQASGQGTAYGQVDIDGAKKLLAEAGAKSPTVRFMYADGNQRREQEFQLIKESAEQAGFKVVGKPSATWGTKLGDKTYDAVVFGWQSTGVSVTESKANYVTNGANNFGGYSNKDVDKLYDELDITTDQAKQTEINGQIEKYLVDDGFGVTIFQFPSITAASDKLEGVDPITISPTIFWNFWEWKLS